MDKTLPTGDDSAEDFRRASGYCHWQTQLVIDRRDQLAAELDRTKTERDRALGLLRRVAEAASQSHASDEFGVMLGEVIVDACNLLLEPGAGRNLEGAKEAAAAGYRVRNDGDPEVYWWTLARTGWQDTVRSTVNFPTIADAWADAISNYRKEQQE